MPRVAIHGFVTDVISVGSGLQYWSIGRDGEPRYSILGIHPRIGASIAIDAHNAFWIRGGGGFTRISERNDSLSVWVLAGEALWVYTPTQHFGITLGPMIESAMKTTSEQRTLKADWLVYGLTFGTLVDL